MADLDWLDEWRRRTINEIQAEPCRTFAPEQRPLLRNQHDWRQCARCHTLHQFGVRRED